MVSAEASLRELGIRLPQARRPFGAYRHLVDQHDHARLVSLQQTTSGLDALEQGGQNAIAVAAAKDYWRKAMKPNCPEKPSLRVLVGDLEFGPNNKIIKFIRNAWNDITKGPGKENEIVKLLDRINGAAKDYDDSVSQNGISNDTVRSTKNYR